jgi:two-component system, LytTR family, sensor kinase
MDAKDIIDEVEVRKWRSARHILLWVVFFAINYAAFGRIYKDNTLVNIVGVFSGFIHTVFVYYLFGYYIFPQYLYKYRFLHFLTFIIFIFYIVYLINYCTFANIQIYSSGYNSSLTTYVERIWFDYLKPNGLFGCFVSLRVAFWNYAISFFYVTLLLSGKAIRDILFYQKKTAKLEIDRIRLERNNLLLVQTNLQLELDFLKTQINPHFLFNTLNSIYAEIVDTNEQAATRLAMLATLMRYGLYETNSERVLLTRELNYIQTYLELEKIRHGNEATIQLMQQGECQDYQIAPLLLISFVENAFKHGINRSKGGAFLAVNSIMQNEKLTFTVSNSVAERVSPNAVGGVGLANTRKRLSLLYPGQHTLDVSETNGQFHVILTLRLPKWKS